MNKHLILDRHTHTHAQCCDPLMCVLVVQCFRRGSFFFTLFSSISWYKTILVSTSWIAKWTGHQDYRWQWIGRIDGHANEHIENCSTKKHTPRERERMVDRIIDSMCDSQKVTSNCKRYWFLSIRTWLTAFLFYDTLNEKCKTSEA